MYDMSPFRLLICVGKCVIFSFLFESVSFVKSLRAPVTMALNLFFLILQFPVCDKSHIKHNELTGDNVGPLILKKKTL